jgi:nucleoside-diphosphate-sugar epimerase
LAACLCERHEVVILDILLRDALSKTGLQEGDGVQLIKGDVRDEECVRRALSGCHRVVHMASLAGVSAVEADPSGTLQTAVEGTANLLRVCDTAPDLKRVVILSSSEVYGPDAKDSREEDATVSANANGARWSYAQGKLAAERMALDHHSQTGLPVTVVRPFNVYGPGQVGEGAVHTFVTRALSNLPLLVYHGGRQVRAWCYVDDLIEGLLRVLFEEQAVGRVFNLGNPDCALTIQALAERIVSLSGSKSGIKAGTRPGPDVMMRTPDISLARRLLGFAPGVGLDSGLGRTLDWYRCNG